MYKRLIKYVLLNTNKVIEFDWVTRLCGARLKVEVILILGLKPISEN